MMSKDHDDKIKQRPLVSVCVPTYNYGRFIADCIESVLAQTMPDWEMIICDDGSTDDTQEIVRRYAAKEPRIRYLINPVRLGMNANIKRAADSGAGKYLKILCSDDWIAPECLESMVRLMKQYPDVVLATSAEIYTDSDGKPLRVQFLFGRPLTVLPGEKMLDRMGFTSHGFGGNSSFFIRNSIYKKVEGYDAGTPYAADLDLAARLCRHGNYLHTDLPLFYGRHHSASSSSNDGKKLVDVLDNFDIPDKIFRPRKPFNREWFRYNVYTAEVTARYMLNIPLQHLRRNHTYASSMVKILARKGNILFGMPWIIPHSVLRAYRLLSGKTTPSWRPPDDWMGPPEKSM